MNRLEHYIQDAMEIRATEMMQAEALRIGMAEASAASKIDALRRQFAQHMAERNITHNELSRYPQYENNLYKHIPVFIERLGEIYPDTTLLFRCIEREARNQSLKADIEIRRSDGKLIWLSLKNYRNSVKRPQVMSGTFNSFALSFLFESAPGVGKFVTPQSDAAEPVIFHGGKSERRDHALTKAGFAPILPIFRELDELNRTIKRNFVYSPEFEYLDEERFDHARKKFGEVGRDLVLQLLERIAPERVLSTIVKRLALDGSEEQLMFDPDRYTDSITVAPFRRLVSAVREGAQLTHRGKGQNIEFTIASEGIDLLTIQIPFTINKNGAWISDAEYKTSPSGLFHEKEGKVLMYGQRRPKKSKELATSVNTYVDYEKGGVFI